VLEVLYFKKTSKTSGEESMNIINDLLHLLDTLPPIYLLIFCCILLIGITLVPTRRRFTYWKYPYRSYSSRNYPYRIPLSRQQQESPAEAAFWHAWTIRHNRIQLEREYSVGPYRLDFAHLETKTAVEIDGMLGHSSPDDISKDRARQREIERQGWRFIRFGAKEVFHNPGQCAREVEQFIRRSAR
jgi:very-short-patch-repair endonuclease